MKKITRRLAAPALALGLVSAVAAPASADEFGPDLTSDVTKFTVGGVLSNTTSKASVPAEVRWKQYDADGICGRSPLTLEWWNGSASVKKSYSVAPTAKAVKAALPANTSVSVSMQSTDCVGNTSDYFDYIDTQLVQQGVANLSAGWQTTSCLCWSNKDAVRSNKAGATATYRFYGDSIGIVTAYAPNRGAANLFEDGVLAGTMNTYRTTNKNMVIGFQRMFTSPGNHTVRIETTTAAQVTLDGFVVGA